MKLMLAGDPAVEANGRLLLQWAGAIWRACGPAATRRRSDPTPVLMDASLRKATANAGKPDQGTWSAVSGPATAAVLTAKRIGWVFMSAFRVSDERGNMIDMAITDPASVKVAVDRATRAESARRAAAKERVGGEEDEIWVEPVRRALASGISPAAKSSLRRAYAGGYWTNARRHAEGLCASSECDKCGGFDDSHHRIWECSHLDDLRLSHTTPAMREEAARAPRDSPYWTRGIAVNPWRTLQPPRRDYEEHWYFGPGVEEERDLSGDLYSDGSATHPQCPEARRAGWSVIQLAADGGVSKAVYGHVPAAESTGQTAGAGEVYALRRAHELSIGPIATTVDYQAIVDGVKAGQAATTAHSKPNAAAWRGIWKASDGEPPVVRKVKAHRTHEEAARSDDPHALTAWRGNRAADHFAKKGAKLHYRADGHVAAVRYERQFDDLTDLCRWIGTALAHWPRAPTGKKTSTPDRYGRAAQTKGNRRAAAAAGHGHRLTRDRDGWKCLTCGKGSLARDGARRLALGRCEGHTGSRVGIQGNRPSAHVLWAAEADPTQLGALQPDVVWCSRCGGYSSTKLYKLGGSCSGVLQRAAQDRMAWFNRGRHPVGKHLLCAPVRLTDAVVRALGEGAARRRAAFNTLLRGDPRLDDRRQAQSEGIGGAVGGAGTATHSETEAHADADAPAHLVVDSVDHLMDIEDHDVFGHGGDLDGAEPTMASAEVKRGWVGGGVASAAADDGASMPQHRGHHHHPHRAAPHDAHAAVCSSPPRDHGISTPPGDAVGKRRRIGDITVEGVSTDRSHDRLAGALSERQGRMPGSSNDHLTDEGRARLSDGGGRGVEDGGGGGGARARHALHAAKRDPSADGVYRAVDVVESGAARGRKKMRLEPPSCEGGTAGRSSHPGHASPVSERRCGDGDAGHPRPCSVKCLKRPRAPIGDRDSGGHAARMRLSRPSRSPPARDACRPAPPAERELIRRRIRGKQPPPDVSGDARASALRPVHSSAVDQHEMDAVVPWPSA